MPNAAQHGYTWQRTDALQLGGEIMEVVRTHGTVAVHLDPVGTLHLQIGVSSVIAPFVLVGVYDGATTVGRIADDILATQAECTAKARA